MTKRVQYLYEVTLQWAINGSKPEVLRGWGKNDQEAAADAMNSAGYGSGAMRALKSWTAKRIDDDKT